MSRSLALVRRPTPRRQTRDAGGVADVEERLNSVCRVVESILRQAATQSDAKLTLEAARHLATMYPALAQLRRQLPVESADDGAPDWHRVRDRLVSALHEYPDARIAAAAALADMNGDGE